MVDELSTDYCVDSSSNMAVRRPTCRAQMSRVIAATNNCRVSCSHYYLVCSHPHIPPLQLPPTAALATTTDDVGLVLGLLSVRVTVRSSVIVNVLSHV